MTPRSRTCSPVASPVGEPELLLQDLVEVPLTEVDQAGVMPPDLTTNSLLFVDSSGRLSKNLGVAIVNPNNVSANVSLVLKKNDGTTVSNTTLTVPSKAQTSKSTPNSWSRRSTRTRPM